ncbi:MAG: CoA transferase [Xanthomonadales bacterium]|jgi:crotonobetainyl-CoA:carnitine CoA-transferase CaiB-like acyl-CoA transferase|nr:CoA transferase [Gammaproteobacteria bacterium]MDH3923026.1 CoA transferase [Xanthomonadales bacterium]
MGVLDGIKVIEVGGIGPAPFCGMMLADMGADVTLVQRRTGNPDLSAADPATMGKYAIFNRGKKSLALDLKEQDAINAVLDLVESSDALIEGFRPGVMERLGLGPDICLERNPQLVYGRVTGWGQFGPLAHAAGHDINYIALSGALYHAGNGSEPPFAPPTLVGDLGGGAMMLLNGILAGILNAGRTGKGQVIDAAISDGSALLNTLLMSFHQMGAWSNNRSDNMFDGGSPWYNSYECADGNFISVGAVESGFYRLLLKKCGLDDDPDFKQQFDKAAWTRGKRKLEILFKTRMRSEWCELLEGTDACFAPVLNLEEAAEHPHNRDRGTFVEVDGVLQAAPAPRFSETHSTLGRPPPAPGADSEAVLQELGYERERIKQLCGLIDA